MYWLILGPHGSIAAKFPSPRNYRERERELSYDVVASSTKQPSSKKSLIAWKEMQSETKLQCCSKEAGEG
jgi:hypothetical protein